MVRSAIAPQSIVRAGLEATYEAANVDGNSIPNAPGVAGQQFLHVKNGGGAPITVTIQTPQTVSGLLIEEQAAVVTNGEERFIGPFPPASFNRADNEVWIDYSAVTTVTVALLRVSSA